MFYASHWAFFLSFVLFSGEGNCVGILRHSASTLILDQGVMGFRVRRQHRPLCKNQAKIPAQQRGVDQLQEDSFSWHDSMDHIYVYAHTHLSIYIYILVFFTLTQSDNFVRKSFRVWRRCCSKKSNNKTDWLPCWHGDSDSFMLETCFVFSHLQLEPDGLKHSHDWQSWANALTFPLRLSPFGFIET